MTIRPALVQYLQYVHNTGGVTPAQFEEDWDPIGHLLLAELHPKYVALGDDKKLRLTTEGEAERVATSKA